MTHDKITDKFYSLVNPQVQIPPIVRRMTGISNRMVREAPVIREVMPEFVHFMGSDILVSHNTIGDLKFLRHFAGRTTGKTLDNFYLCTHLLAEKIFPAAPDKSLGGIAKYLGITTPDKTHRAEADARMTVDVFYGLLEKFSEQHLDSVEDGIRFQEDLESAIRLGWGLREQQITTILHQPGVIRLFDRRDNEIFLTSSFNCKQALESLQNVDIVPRQVLKIVLKSFDVKIDYFPHIYPAMLHEKKLLEQRPLRVTPASWHQRIITSFCLAEDPGSAENVLVRISSPEAGTLGLFGPVIDKKEASELLKELAEVLSGEKIAKGFRFSRQYLALIIDFFSGFEEGGSDSNPLHCLNLRLFFSRSYRSRRLEQLKIMRSLRSLKQKYPRYKDLRKDSGLIIVEGEKPGSQLIYPLINSSSEQPVEVAGPGREWLFDSQQGQEFLKDFKSRTEEAASVDLKGQVCPPSLWMIHSKKDRPPRGSFYIPVQEIQTGKS